MSISFLVQWHVKITSLSYSFFKQTIQTVLIHSFTHHLFGNIFCASILLISLVQRNPADFSEFMVWEWLPYWDKGLWLPSRLMNVCKYGSCVSVWLGSGCPGFSWPRFNGKSSFNFLNWTILSNTEILPSRELWNAAYPVQYVCY